MFILSFIVVSSLLTWSVRGHSKLVTLQLRNDSTRPTRDLWRRAVDRGHGGATTRSDGPRRLRDHDDDDDDEGGGVDLSEADGEDRLHCCYAAISVRNWLS